MEALQLSNDQLAVAAPQHRLSNELTSLVVIALALALALTTVATESAVYVRKQ